MIPSIISRRFLYLKQTNVLIPFNTTTSVKRTKCHTNLIFTAVRNKQENSIESMYKIPTNLNCCVRNKYTKGSAKDDETDSDDEGVHDFKDEKDSKVVKMRMNSLRADLVVKAGLGIARNKVEVIFYESKIRVNGEKISKKSLNLSIGDEIDVIKGYSDINPSNLIVSRITILSATETDENISVILRRFKNLLIENYAGANAWKGTS